MFGPRLTSLVCFLRIIPQGPPWVDHTSKAWWLVRSSFILHKSGGECKYHVWRHLKLPRVKNPAVCFRFVCHSELETGNISMSIIEYYLSTHNMIAQLKSLSTAFILHSTLAWIFCKAWFPWHWCIWRLFLSMREYSLHLGLLSSFFVLVFINFWDFICVLVWHCLSLCWPMVEMCLHMLICHCIIVWVKLLEFHLRDVLILSTFNR